MLQQPKYTYIFFPIVMIIPLLYENEKYKKLTP